jgi:hypothetical protein
MENHVREKRDELIWALSLQDYTQAQIGRIFGLNRSTVLRIIEAKPKDWKPKWVKV